MAVLYKNGHEVLRFERPVKYTSIVEGDWVSGKTVLSIRSNRWILKKSIRKYRSEYSTRKDKMEYLDRGWKRYKRYNTSTVLLRGGLGDLQTIIDYWTSKGFKLL